MNAYQAIVAPAQPANKLPEAEPTSIFVVVGGDLPAAAFRRAEDAYVGARKKDYRKQVEGGWEPFPLYWRTVELELK